MSASQSNLSASRYGYDFVVATTQASINTTMKEYLAGVAEPVVTVCYVANAQGNPVPIAYNLLVEKAKGADPFTIPANANPSNNQNLKNLMAARFMFGFRAQIGLPPPQPGLPPLVAAAQIPDIVTLGSDTSAVKFNLLCSQFTVVELKPAGGYSPATWMSISQQPGHPWVFSSKVDLRLSTTAQGAYSKLPAAVQKQIKNLGDSAFSVQQLLFDLNNAGLQAMPTISGVQPGTELYSVLEQEFVGAYFTHMKTGGQPLLGCTITQGTAPVSTLTLTDLNMEVSPFLGSNGQPIINADADQLNLATLSYLCAANGDPLPAAVPFGWNWIEAPEETDYHGTVAISRSAFANYFRYQMMSYVSSNCYLPSVTVSLDAASQPQYSWNLTANQVPTVTMPATGTTVLTFHQDADASDQAGLGGDIGQLELHPSFDVTVTFSGDTITVVQHLVIYLRLQHLATSANGNVVDVTVTDTYTILVNQSGQLTTTLVTNRTDNSQNPSVDPFLNFFTNLNTLISNVETWLRNVVSTDLKDIPVSVVQNFVFPGGKTFAFSNGAFSEYGDLASHITYAGPS
jgi:hypothetical protein